jgi:hypothetical protein
MELKKLLIPIVLFLTVSNASAQDVNCTWNYSEEEQAKITGFRIYNENLEIVLDGIDPSARTATFVANDTECGAYYMTAFARNEEEDTFVESTNSNVEVVCPNQPSIPAPVTFNISEVEPETGETK